MLTFYRIYSILMHAGPLYIVHYLWNSFVDQHRFDADPDPNFPVDAGISFLLVSNVS